MSPPYEYLKRKFVQTALDHRHAGSRYFAALPGKTDPAIQKEAAENYKIVTERFMAAILAYEQHLLSVDREIEMERELERMLTHKDFVTFVLRVI